MKKETAKAVIKIGAKPAPPFTGTRAKPNKEGSTSKPRAIKRPLNAEVAKKLAKGKKEPEPEQKVAFEDLKRIIKLVNLLVEAQRKRAAAELALVECKKAEQSLEREMIPGVMDEVGITSLRLASGQTISIVPDCEAKIPEAKKEKALAWLLKHGFGGLIKTDVSLSFAKGEHDAAVKVQTTLTRMFPRNPTTLDETVHPQTLKSFVKERHAEGEPVPADLFGVFMFKKAVIKES